MMFSRILNSFALAWRNLAVNWLHTFFSVLGIIIGVASLVAILSLIDGMEKYARNQITGTTSLQTIIIIVDQFKEQDGIKLRREDPFYFDYARVQDALQTLPNSTKAYMGYQKPRQLNKPNGEVLGINVSLVSEYIRPGYQIKAGRGFTHNDLVTAKKIALVDSIFAAKYFGATTYASIIGKEIKLDSATYSIVGVTDGNSKSASLYIPITLASASTLKAENPTVIIEPAKVESVLSVRQSLEAWFRDNYPTYANQTKFITNDFRLEQVETGILTFKLIMGLITGISVLVGGVGVMNVLLISVNERTKEIGVRKAAGAKSVDILLQFLSESITISGFGSIIGLVLGILGALVLNPIVSHLIKAPFSAAFTASTIGLIALLSIAIGVVFGTYPAMRAARLNPVDAIRKE